LKKECWRFIDSGSLTAAQNMAIDEAIQILHAQGEAPPTLRFYGWAPPALSIGYFQKVEKEVDLERLAAYGLDLVRRNTGGRAVLHDQEITYSVVVSEHHPLLPSSVTESYRVISSGLLQGFKELGLEASFAIPDEEMKKNLKDPRSAVCFDSSSWYELVVEGRKVAGSAQVRQKGAILQHGSILIEVDEQKLFDVCRFPSEKVRKRLQDSFVTKAVALKQLLPSIELNAIKDAFIVGFEKSLGIQIQQGRLTEAETRLADQLLLTKYATREWTYRK